MTMKLFANGFRRKNGIVYGFWSQDGNNLELMIVDYRRLNLRKLRKEGNWKKHKPKDVSWKKYWETRKHDVLISKLNQLMKLSIQNKEITGTDAEFDKSLKVANKRIPMWIKELVKYNLVSK